MLIRRISVVLGCLLGCADSRSPFPAEVTLSPVDTLITTESALLVRPTEITVGDDGRLFMADAGASVIVVTGPEGDFRQAIGRQGAGPGEFERPRSMVVFRDTLMLIDGGQGRLVIFSTAGKFVASRSLPAEGTSLASASYPP